MYTLALHSASASAWRVPGEAVNMSTTDNVAASTIRCQYPSKLCSQLRARKRNGALHRFCEVHRSRANRNQLRWSRQQRDLTTRDHGRVGRRGARKAQSLRLSCKDSLGADVLSEAFNCVSDSLSQSQQVTPGRFAMKGVDVNAAHEPYGVRAFASDRAIEWSEQEVTLLYDMLFDSSFVRMLCDDNSHGSKGEDSWAMIDGESMHTTLTHEY